MATPQPTTAKKTETGRLRSSRSKTERRAKRPYPLNAKLKTVVRRLPPNLPEDIFWQSVQPWVTDETASWRKFFPGKVTKKYNKDNIPSRAYIAFRDTEQLVAFSRAYNGHVFRDKSGNETYAVVEFAPFQKVPSEKTKQDPRMGTIEQDEDFISFMAALNAPVMKPSESDTLETLIASTQSTEESKITPLLEALIAEKQVQRDKETILKAHAHYRRGAAKELEKTPEEMVARRRGKQQQIASKSERDEGTSAPSQGNLRRSKKSEIEEMERKKGKEKERGKGKGKEREKLKEKEKDSDKKDSTSSVPKVANRPQPKDHPKAMHQDVSQQTPAMPQASMAKEVETAAAEGRKPRARPALGMARHFQAALDGVKKAAEPTAAAATATTSSAPRDSIPDPPVGSSADDDRAEKVEKTQPPLSPSKERFRTRRKQEKSSTPAILRRSDVSVPTPFSVVADPVAGEQLVLSPSVRGPEKRGTLAEGRGGRRRGRGRGQPPAPSGRGGTPQAGGASLVDTL